ncbi:PA2169 family four-helix-bundle protein [Methylotenera versatilis]|uniref:PA2169 family four-helix-bundle protein n=1 Tax=Methylotenera versatilis TaxID=1055487 RepID=UPI0006455D65|nr:PA2169 family four-helix-bundle protein [Methylotenera versatilis]
MNNDEAISVLNGLIEVSKDGEEGFLQSSQSVDDPKLKAYFLHRSHEVKQSVYELQALVRELGGKPADSASIGGYLHRRWIDIKTAITSNDNLAVLNEVERGEDVALNAYIDASKKTLPVAVNQLILRQLKGAQRNHDEVKQLRDTFEFQAH